MKVISDSSPLIGLSSIGQLNTLKTLWGNVVIPEAVFNEVVILGRGKTGSKEVETACRDWLNIVKVQNKQELDALETMLDLGEAEVITLGQEICADLLLINNREPRRFARSLAFDILGTVGIIKLAWMKGIIEDPIGAINEIRLRGFWIGNQLIERVEAEIRGQKKK